MKNQNWGKQFFVMLLMSTFLGSVDLNAMMHGQQQLRTGRTDAPQRRQANAPQRLPQGADQAVEHPQLLNFLRPGARVLDRNRLDEGVQLPDPNQIPGLQQKVSSILKKFITAPWNFGATITSYINTATTHVEPATQVFTRCFLEGVVCGILLYLAFGEVISDAADTRYDLAHCAAHDVFVSVKDQKCFTGSRLWIAVSGLQCFATFLGISGFRLYAQFFGTIIGIRCAYDFFYKLSVSLMGTHEPANRPRLFPY